MAENTNQSIYIIQDQSAYDSNAGSDGGREVTQDEYQAWVTDNDLQAIDQRGELVDIVGGTNKYSITNTDLTPGATGGTTVTTGYEQIEVNTFDANTLYEQAVAENAAVKLTDAEVLEILQENINAAVALRDEVLADSDIDPNAFTIRDGVGGSPTFGQIVTTTTAVNAAIDGAYAAYDAFKENPQAFVDLIRTPVLEALGEVLADAEAGVRAVDIDFVPFDGQVNSTTVDTTGQTVSQSSIATASQTFISNQNLITTLTGDDINTADFAIQLLRIQEANQDVQGDPIIRQILVDLKGTFGTEAELRAAAAAEISEYFGINNPLGQSAVDRALKLITAQLPGVSDIRTISGISNKALTINDILTKDNIDLQDIYNVARTVALVVNPALRVPLAVVETLVNIAGGGGSDLANADAGSPTNSPAEVGGIFVAEYNTITGTYDVVNTATGEIIVSGLSQLQATQEAKTASLGDPSYFSTAGGGGDDDFPPGDIDFGPVAVDNNDPSAQATNNAEDQFVDNGTGLLVLPEDLFTETDGGLYILTEEIDENVENTDAESVDDTTLSYYPNGLPYDDDGNLNPGWAINPETGEPYFIGGDYVDQNTLDLATEAREAAAAAATINARSQAIQQSQRKQANDGDWRVRLRLAPLADYLYKEPGLTEEGILYPLKNTDGVLFPYMPNIQTAYHANYNSYDLTHSNYRGYFYQNSYVGEVNLSAVFTAQDTKEAEYLLAVIHFFRSATKMFYGQDTVGRGSPPPLVYLQGLGEYQFNLHPCLISQFSYNLPNDVDYIRARSPNITGTNLQFKRDRQFAATNPFSAALQRLAAVGQPKGGIFIPPAPNTLGLASPTYVPTRIEMQITLLPTQSREQVSSQFSFSKFANGNLLRGGFW